MLLEALEKSIWPSLRNKVRKEVTRIFCDKDRGGIGHSSSWICVKCCYKWKEIIHCNKGCVQSNVTLCLGGGGPTQGSTKMFDNAPT